MKLMIEASLTDHFRGLGCNGMSCEPALLTIVKQATVVREYLAADPLKSKRGIKVRRTTYIYRRQYVSKEPFWGRSLMTLFNYSNG